MRMMFLIVENLLVMKITSLSQDVLDFFQRQKSQVWTADNGVVISQGSFLATNDTGLTLPNFVVPMNHENKDLQTRTVHCRVTASSDNAEKQRDRFVIAIDELNKQVAAELAALKAAEKLVETRPADWTETK